MTLTIGGSGGGGGSALSPPAPLNVGGGSGSAENWAAPQESVITPVADGQVLALMRATGDCRVDSLSLLISAVGQASTAGGAESTLSAASVAVYNDTAGFFMTDRFAVPVNASGIMVGAGTLINFANTLLHRVARAGDLLKLVWSQTGLIRFTDDDTRAPSGYPCQLQVIGISLAASAEGMVAPVHEASPIVVAKAIGSSHYDFLYGVQRVGTDIGASLDEDDPFEPVQVERIWTKQQLAVFMGAGAVKGYSGNPYDGMQVFLTSPSELRGPIWWNTSDGWWTDSAGEHIEDLDDLAIPQVSAMYPAGDGDVDVPINAEFEVDCDSDISAMTGYLVDKADPNFGDEQLEAHLGAEFVCDGASALWTPAEGALEAGHSYVMAITQVTGVNGIVNDAVLRQVEGFTILDDAEAPTVVSTSPAPGASGVAVDAALTVEFSEEMFGSNLEPNSVKLVASDGSAADVATTSVTKVGATATLHMAGALTPGGAYKFRVTVEATDLYGNPIASQYTSASPFTVAP